MYDRRQQGAHGKPTNSPELRRTHPLSGPSGGLVVGTLGLLLALVLLGGLVELVGNGLLVLGVEVLVRVLDSLLVRRTGVLGVSTTASALVGG